ncbi:hypothetical protein HRbin39_00446 [bacterium HR39]|nr:hypothetical protein HRbin39_00446 [bacterium HR39]
MGGQHPRVHHHLEPPLGPAEDVDLGHARHAGEALAHHVAREVAVFVDRPVVAGRPGEDEPGDGVVLVAGGGQPRLVGLVGKVRDGREPVGDQHQRPVDVGVDGELEGELGAAVLRHAEHLLEALEPLQCVLLADQDLPLHLLRRSAGPVGGHRDHRAAHLGRELHGDAEQRHHPEQQHQRRDRESGNGPLHREADRLHPCPPPPATTTGWPGRSRSLPRTTTGVPGSSPSTATRSPTAGPGTTSRGTALPSWTTYTR